MREQESKLILSEKYREDMFYKITRNISSKVKAIADMYKFSEKVNKELFKESLTEVVEELKSIRSQVNEICGTEIKDKYEYKSYEHNEGIDDTLKTYSKFRLFSIAGFFQNRMPINQEVADMFNNDIEDLIKDYMRVIEEIDNNPN